MTAIIQMFEDSILSKKKQIDKAENTEDIMALLTFTDDEKEKLHKKLAKLIPNKNKNKGSTGRPKNSWMLYLDEYRSTHKQEGVSGKDIVKQASSHWKSMSDKDKALYEEKANNLMKAYKEKKQDENSDNSDDEKTDKKTDKVEKTLEVDEKKDEDEKVDNPDSKKDKNTKPKPKKDTAQKEHKPKKTTAKKTTVKK